MTETIPSDSWIGQLVKKYKNISVDKLDDANLIICDALDEMIALEKR